MSADKDGSASGDDARRRRLADQLRENLKRRKLQARSRRAGQEDRREEGIEVARSGAPAEGGEDDR